MSVERIDKLLASQGTKSRSDVKKLIKSGAVTVNGEKIKDFSMKINPEKEEVCIYGKPVSIAGYVYLMMNKPAGVVCATRDKKEKTVIDIIPEEFRRKDIFPVGRLDKDTEGLLIITNDGEFAHKVTSPEKNIYKTYHAVTDSSINDSDIEAFENGIMFRDGTKCRKAFLRQLNDETNPLVEVRICEGMFHQVKKMLAVRGKNVLYLKRIAIGKLYLDSALNKNEVKHLNDIDKLNIFLDELH